MQFKKIVSVVAIFVCLSVLLGTASAVQPLPNSFENAEYNVSAATAQAYAASETQEFDKNATYEIRFIFAFMREDGDFGSEIKKFCWYGGKYKILSQKGYYSRVRNEDGETGYIFTLLLREKGKSNANNGFSLNRSYDHVYVGGNNLNSEGNIRTYVIYDGDKSEIRWESDNSEIVDVDEKTGLMEGKNPGVTKIHAKIGLTKDVACEVACISGWKEKEVSKATKEVSFYKLPGKGKMSPTVASGTSITALGDLVDGKGWIYATANGIWGFIKLDDFPGIDYLFTEYHYYDEGYQLRFNNINQKTVSENIYEYSSVLNDKMMGLFKLKVSPIVSYRSSVGDDCKESSYGSVKTQNLASQCPQTANHKVGSCLQTKYYRESLSGNKYKTDVSWTGHILLNNARSNSTLGQGSIVITPYKVVNQSTYNNLSDYEIRRKQTSTLMHETIHQFGVHDHYCYRDWDAGEDKCSNSGCYICFGNSVEPDCMMMNTKYPTETNNLLCDNCKKNISSYLSNR